MAALRQQLAGQQQRIRQLEGQLMAVSPSSLGAPWTAATRESVSERAADRQTAGGSFWDKTMVKLRRMQPESFSGWVWFTIGFGGEFIFFLRFVVQWWASERRKMTVVPMAFWHLSLIGTALVLAYALFRIDPVFILAYSLNIFLYVRNLMIAQRQPAAAMVAEKTSE